MREKGVAISYASHKSVFQAFFVLLFPQKKTKQKVQKYVVSYFLEILGSTTIIWIKYSAELV